MTEQHIRKSPAILIIKIVFAELLTECVNLLLHGVLGNLNANGASNTHHSLILAVNLVMSIIALILFVVIFSIWLAEETTVRDSELEYKHGVIRSTTSSYPYANMQRIQVRQGAIGKLFGYGTVLIYMPVLGNDIPFADIPEPHAFADHIKTKMAEPKQAQYLIQQAAKR